MLKRLFSINDWLRRFGYALQGITRSFRTEPTMWVHLSCTVVVILLSVVKGVTSAEAIVLIFSAGLVWAAELFNTAIEKLADSITREINAQTKAVKDLAAAAVLVTSFIALSSGLIIFIPKFFTV